MRPLDVVRVLLDEQREVISRQQCLQAGLSRSTLATLIKTKRWQRVHQGVFVAHSGTVSDDARIQAALLAMPGTVVCNETALWLPKRRGPLVTPIHLAAETTRAPRPRKGITLHLLKDVEAVGSDPPRMSYERALLETVTGLGTATAVEHLVCQTVGDRVTTPARIEAVLKTRLRQGWRGLLTQMLNEVAVGAQSPLELLDLRNDQRHRLPLGHRQVKQRAGGRGRWLDVVIVAGAHPDLVVVKELDGRLGHEATGRFRDMSRDNATVIAGGRTVRFGWADMFGAPCETAAWQVLLWSRLGIEVGSTCGLPDCALAKRVQRLDAAHPRLSVSA